MRHSALPWLLLAVSASGCTFKFDLTSQRTALENQVIGAYKELDDDVILASSVRAPDPKATVPKLSAERKRAVDARQNQDFNRDDIEELKDKQVLGEAVDGTVVVLPSGVAGIQPGTSDVRLAMQLVDEENKDRMTVWHRLIEASETLEDKDLPAVRRTRAKEQRDQAAPGQWIQDENGQWLRKADQ